MSNDIKDFELLKASELWTRPEPGARQTGLSRNDIATTALKIADTEGITALSMRRLADALNVGTMTLYSYVQNKEELLLLLGDAIMQKAIVSQSKLSDDWREALVEIASHTRKIFQKHSWVFDIQDDTGPGPNSIKHYDNSLQTIMHLDISLAEKIDILASVYNYIFGFCAAERHVLKKHAKSDCIHNYFELLFDSGDYPALAQVCEENGLDKVFSEVERSKKDPMRFERNLKRMLDGFDY